MSCAALRLLSLALLLVLLLVEPLRARLVLGVRRARGVNLDDGDGGAAASNAPSFPGICLPVTDERLAMLAARLKAPPDPPGDVAAAPLPVMVLTLLRDELRACPLDAAPLIAPRNTELVYMRLLRRGKEAWQQADTFTTKAT